MSGRGRPFRPGQSGNPGGARAFPPRRGPWPATLPTVLELLAKLNREIGSRSDEAPAVRIVIGGNIPLDGKRVGPPPALPALTDPDLPDP
jgi:hypothetical protein